MYCFASKNFFLCLAPTIVFEPEDCDDNTDLRVKLSGEGYNISTVMHVDIYDLAAFADALCTLRETLNGRVLLEESPESEAYLLFEGDGRGHITVSGRLLAGDGEDDRLWSAFRFAGDQTMLPAAEQMREDLSEYL